MTQHLRNSGSAKFDDVAPSGSGSISGSISGSMTLMSGS